MNLSAFFSFEKNLDDEAWLLWFRSYWSLSVVFATVYLILVYFGQRWMQRRPAFELRAILPVWDLILATFSLLATARLFPIIFDEWRNHGFEYTVCDASHLMVNPTFQFWGWYFVWSKVFELGDTAFIVLRKQRLIFLHWYHHVTVLIHTWNCVRFLFPITQWFVLMNCIVHAAMYSYYAFRSMKFKVPRPVAMAITSAQLMQMLGGIYANWRAFWAIFGGRHCDTAIWNIQVSVLMYVSYWLLFTHFFYTNYLKKAQKQKNV